LLNKLEAKWFESASFGSQWVICDQLAMAVVLNEKVVQKHLDCYVNITISFLSRQDLSL